MKAVHIIGYGNTLRQDDGLGPGLIEKIRHETGPGITLECKQQLTPEDCLSFREKDIVIFADATVDCEGPFCFYCIKPVFGISYSMSTYSPEMIMALSSMMSDKKTTGYVLAIRGYSFGMVDELSPEARLNLEGACRFITGKLELLQRADTSL